jgi:hypothetical protein
MSLIAARAVTRNAMVMRQAIGRRSMHVGECYVSSERDRVNLSTLSSRQRDWQREHLNGKI